MNFIKAHVNVMQAPKIVGDTSCRMFLPHKREKVLRPLGQHVLASGVILLETVSSVNVTSLKRNNNKKTSDAKN
jgi:hypothetical protein